MSRCSPDGKPRVKKVPKRIMFYRDGVSEGQFSQVIDVELKQIQDACAEAKLDVKITYIVVRKGHHVRFFPQNEANKDKGGNCKAGLVVDRDVTHPLIFEFYLQSHSGMLSQASPAQGTTRPALYSVLHDDNEFTPDALQRLTYALCYVYARATRSVSIPAPVYCELYIPSIYTTTISDGEP
ncbi:hypothetical protein EIP86_004332 [Pleurotus ostreatoroseus]|nr:hypothetical protein EIP86_004332 [Pleurotus ostreatoroseus]